MKTLLTAMLAIAFVVAATVHAAPPFAGNAFDVDVYTDVSRAPTRMCIGFEEGGRFTMSNAPHTMRWDVQVGDERSFLAVTEPADRVVIPYHMAVYGTLLADGLFIGSGIDEFGETFRFIGSRNKDCFYAEPGTHAANGKAALPVDIRYRSAGEEPNPIRDPCWLPPDWGFFCDPAPNPLGEEAKESQESEDSAESGLEGRSFELTLGSNGYATRNYCWTFAGDSKIATSATGELTWSSGGKRSKGFESVGAGPRAVGLGYRGELVDIDLLRVDGIEARNGRSVVTYGYGQAVKSCD